jgi:hypothetical protein
MVKVEEKMDAITWIQSNPVAATIIVTLITVSGSLIGIVISIISTNADRKRQMREQRFENYHQLISDLVEGRKGQKEPRIDSQIAVVFELRNYLEYRKVTIRILDGLLQIWQENQKTKRLITEINITLSVLRSYSKWRIWKRRID